MATVEEIRERSAELQRLHARIRELSVLRDYSPEHRRQWSEACRRFHQHFDEFADPSGAGTRDMRNDPVAREAAVNFLLADPYHFASGYAKADLWRRLAGCELSSKEVEALEQAALLYLDRRISREFWNMCKTMGRIGGADFWRHVESRSLAQDAPESIRARCLLAHKSDVHSGARLRREFYRRHLERRWARA